MDNIKTMPHSESAEEAVIGSILIDGGKGFEKANAWIRESNAFYSDKNKILYETISILHRENKNIDMVTVVDRIKDMGKENESIGLDMYYISGLPI